MNRLVYALLGVYKLVLKTGLLQTRLGQALFTRAYMIYKRLIEARHTDVLLQHIPVGTCVIDVGANIGFFTLQFAQQVGSSGHVIAIEPEAHNFKQLEKQVQRAGFGSRVTLIEAVAAESTGERQLQLDPYHPANHKIGIEGVPVRAVTLDHLAAAQPLPVAFIKIDVQGAEMQVLDGCQQTLSQQHPALFIEVDDEALHSFGSSAATLLQRLAGAGYHIHQVQAGGISAPIPPEQALSQQVAEGYTDFLFLYPPA
jgi:FkbM family methyltransferase